MSEKLKASLVNSFKVALWVAVSAGATYLITNLLNVPELAPYYGILNIFLVFAKSLKKA